MPYRKKINSDSRCRIYLHKFHYTVDFKTQSWSSEQLLADQFSFSVILNWCSNTSLKPMDSFGTWRKWKLIYIFFFMQNFIGLYELFNNVLLTVHSEMLPFSGYNRTLCHRFVHNDNLPLGNIALQYVIPNNCRKVWWCFLIISCTFWRSRKN